MLIAMFIAKIIIGLFLFFMFWPVVNRIKYAHKGLSAFVWSALFFFIFSSLVAFVVGSTKAGMFAIVLCAIYLWRAYFLPAPVEAQGSSFNYTFYQKSTNHNNTQQQENTDIEVDYKKL